MAAVLVLSSTSCQQGARGTGATPSQAPANGRQVEVVRAECKPLDRTITALGSFAAKQQAQLSAKVPGRLKAIYVDLGTVVQQGQTIAEIEPIEYQLGLQQAQAALAQARARLGISLEGDQDAFEPEETTTVREAKAVFEEARANRDRVKRLQEQGILSTSESESVEATYQVALSRHQAAREEVRQRQATLAQRRVEVEIARQQLTDATLVAPFSGTVQMRHADPGQYLKTGDPLVTLVQVDPLRLRLEVPEKDAVRIRDGQAVRFRVTGEDRERTAAVSRVSPSLGQTSRMLAVEADVANDGSLHPGSFAQAQIVIERDTAALVVPTRAVRTFAGLEKVFLAVEGAAVEKEVATGQRGTDWVEILKGVSEGDRVILDPGNLRNGEPVAPVGLPDS